MKQSKQVYSGFAVRLSIIWIGLSLGACATGPQIQVQPVSHRHFSSRSLVQTLSTAPTTPYTLIARLRVTGSPNEDRAQILAALLKKAAAVGANALLITNEQVQTQNTAPATFNPSGGNYTPSVPQRILHIDAEALYLANNTVREH
jgi:hypothetical protein